MGRFNELLNTGAQLGRGFGILLGLQEQEGITTSAPELMPILDPDGSPERPAAMGYVSLIGFQPGLAAGGVGFRSQIAIDNPIGSQQVVILERIRTIETGIETVTAAWSAIQLTGSTGNLIARDSRQIVTPGFSAPSSARIRTQNNAALSGTATNIDVFTAAAGSFREIVYGLVIAPGHSVRFFPGSDNAALQTNITFFCKARQLNPRELSL